MICYQIHSSFISRLRFKLITSELKFRSADVSYFTLRIRYLGINLDKEEINFHDRLSKGIIICFLVIAQYHQVTFRFGLAILYWSD